MSEIERVDGRGSVMQDLHVVIVNLQDMRDLRERFPQVRLIEMARVEMEVSMRDIVLVPRRPRFVFPILFPARGKPLLQQWDFSPDPVSVDLVAQAQLRMESTAFDMLGHDVFPHEADPTQSRPLVGTHVEGEVIA